MGNRRDNSGRFAGQAIGGNAGDGCNMQATFPKLEPSREEVLRKELDQEVEHKRLQDENAAFLDTICDARFGIEEQTSNRLYAWFKHMGFWPDWWDPNLVQAPYGGHQESITIPFEEYVRLKKMEKLGLIVTEVAEAMEAVRRGDRDNEVEELADVDVRMHDYKGGFGFTRKGPFERPAAEAFIEKMKKNLLRPFRHGKKF